MQVDPRRNFEFGVLDKGTYRFKIKETGVDEPKEGKTSGKRYWARLIAVGGESDGESHIESFLENTKEDFSFVKLAGFLVALGTLPATGKIETNMFRTREFEERWKKQLSGKEMGGKIGHRTKDKDGKPLDNPQSELKAYYTIPELLEIQAKETGKAATAAPAPAPQAPPPVETPAPAPAADQGGFWK